VLAANLAGRQPSGVFLQYLDDLLFVSLWERTLPKTGGI
jgi:hypothetical protein